MCARRLLASPGPSPRRLAFESEIENVPRTVVARGQNYEMGLRTGLHVHSRSQLMLAEYGTMTVTAGSRAWALPPQRAIWIPAGVEHSVHSNEPLSVRSIFVDPARKALPSECCVISVTPLLRELVLHAVTLPRLYAIGGPEDRLMTVLLEQLEAAPLAPFHLPMPTDRRLRKIATVLLERPADTRSAREWGKEVGISARTLSRLFPLETGMSFRHWRQHARILEAVRRLAAGGAVTNVAVEVGYETPSAFVLMFRSIMGKTPGQYLQDLSEKTSRSSRRSTQCES